MSNELIKSMKNWLIDCFDTFEDSINNSSDEKIVKAVNKYYEGGVKQFIADENINTIF